MPHLILRQNTKKASRSMIATLALLAVVSAAHARDVVQPVSQDAINQAKKQRHVKKRSARELIGSIDPDLDASVGVGDTKHSVSVGYNYTVNPSYQSGLYTRIDRWHPQGSLQLIPGLRGSASGEIVVVRQFKSKSEALKAHPAMRLSRLPFTASNALGLEPGAIMMVPVRFESFEGPEGSATLAGPLSVYGRVGHVDRGSYQVQVQRLTGDRVRIRFVGTRQHALDAEGGVRLGIGPVSSPLLSASRTKGKRSTVAAEYVFDLANPDARQAYDNMFKKDGLRPRLALANPFGSTENLKNRLGDGLSGVDAIATSDSTLPVGSRRIVQSFKSVETGTPDERIKGANLLGLVRLGRATTFTSDSRLSYEDDGGVAHTTLAPTAESVRSTRLLFGLRNESETRRASLIMKTNEAGVPTGTGEYVVTLELKDKRMGKSETRKAREKLAHLIAPSILQQLNIDPILTSTSYKNARVYSQVIFTEDAFARIAGLSSSSLESSLTSYLQSVGSSSAGHDSSIRKVADLLAKALDPAQEPTERANLFAKLQHENLFRDEGSGFLMSLLPANELESLVSVYIRIDAAAFDKSIKVRFGKSDFHNLENAIECSAYQNNRSSIDLRLEDVCAGVSTSTSTQPGLTYATPAAAAAPAVK